MSLSAREARAKIEAYQRRESSDLSGLPAPTVERLQARRSTQDAAHEAYESRQAEEAKQRETMVRAQYLAAGNTEADWARDRTRVLSDAAVARMRGSQGGSLISREQFLA